MRYARPTRRQRRKLVSLATILLLYVCMLPVAPFWPSSHAATKAPQPPPQDDNGDRSTVTSDTPSGPPT